MRATWGNARRQVRQPRVRPHRRSPRGGVRNAPVASPEAAPVSSCPIRSDQGPSASIRRPGGAVDHEGGLVRSVSPSPGPPPRPPARSARHRKTTTPVSSWVAIGDDASGAGQLRGQQAQIGQPGGQAGLDPARGEEDIALGGDGAVGQPQDRAAGCQVSSRDKSKNTRSGPRPATRRARGDADRPGPVVAGPDRAARALPSSGVTSPDRVTSPAPCSPAPANPENRAKSSVRAVRSNRVHSPSAGPPRRKALPSNSTLGGGARASSAGAAPGDCPRPGPGRSDRRCRCQIASARAGSSSARPRAP